ncbi:MAG TPA: adenosine deaminase [Kineobactrum sp.]
MIHVLHYRPARFMFVALLLLALALAPVARASLPPPQADTAAWFESFKTTATAQELYRFLYAMPKGGDLHSHLSGSIFSDWFYDLALAESARGYIFYTKVQINNCRAFGDNQFGPSPYLLLFVNILERHWQALDSCEQAEYVRLDQLNPAQKAGWMNSLRLDAEHEGRDEFFQTHWQRMNDVFRSPHLAAEALVQNMKAFGAEGLIYLEMMAGVGGFEYPDGTPITADEAAAVYRQRLQQKDAVDTGVAVRLQDSILRFAPDAEDQLIRLYDFVSRHSDLWVAVNMVGREDNDKGYPLRFLDTLRELRKRYHNVRLSIHAGEVDEPNHHVRDTLLLGADRIGHGINLISDPDTMRLMRHGPYLVEINLISNLLLEYVDDYQQHPFPEYLRMGIPVALSTDDRGMWDSNMTDEFFVAVREFNLSWPELVLLSRNSLAYSFAPEALRAEMIERFEKRIAAFERQLRRRPEAALADDALTYGFICKRYELCEL